MAQPTWSPWHTVVTLREDLKTGELALHEFAADLYDVALQRGTRPIYENAAQFFALTFPTLPLRELARDVIQRLAGKNTKAVRQLELTYGGGKTHTLITLFHLANDPETLPDIPAVHDFKADVGIAIPRARIAVLPFDKIDVEKGMVARAPSGDERMLRKPWSILAWQLAGADGLRLLHPDEQDDERQSAPAENLLRELLDLPARDGLGTLVLIDEVLMFARGAVDADPGWTERLKNFFQALTQAATKVDRCAVIASLLATNPELYDERGQQITRDMYDIFRREREQGVEPVSKTDVAEVLRRRFFTPESIQDPARFRPNVIEAVKNIATLDDDTKKSRAAVEERFVQSYPFHPDLTEVLYAKWTGVQGFQRTRGVLRTFALALRDSASWDTSPVAGPNVFLPRPKADGISEAARELTQIATFDQVEAGPQDWTAILGGELDKARAVQQEYGSLQHRELEQAVIATFLHSQPTGKKAQLRELKLLIGSTRPDAIDLDKALREWFDRSWFLDESLDSPGNRTEPPQAWRLGSRPNLKQMHNDAMTTIADVVVEARLVEEIRKTKSLTAAARMAGAQVHNLPDKPSFIDDDGEFRYAVLGPAAASDSGKPSAYARRFLDETTSPDRPRTNRNAVVLAVPSRDGVEGATRALREYLGWLSVQDSLSRGGQPLDISRQQSLDTYLATSRDRVAEAIQQAYSIVVTVSEANDAQAFKIQVADAPLFSVIKGDKRSRIQDSAISPDAMLPGGPYDLWREGEDSRWVKDIVGAFAQNPRLPKMLSRQAILDTVVRGVEDGYFVARLRRPDGSMRTWWRQRPDAAALEDVLLEVVLPDKVELTSVPTALVRPGAIDELWAQPMTAVGAVRSFFDGEHTMTVSRGGFDEPILIPRASSEVVDEAIREAVRAGDLWLTAGPASLLAEEVPAGLLTTAAELHVPPAPLAPIELLPAALPGAWQDERTTALSLAAALSQRAERTLPWTVVRTALESALRARVVELADGSGPWPCDFSGASAVMLRTPSARPGEGEPRGRGEPVPPVPPDTRQTPEVSLSAAQLQDLLEVLPELLRVAAGHEVSFRLKVAVRGSERPSDEVTTAVSQLLAGVRDGFEIV